MARTIEEIFDEIIRAKTQDTRLDELTSTSKTAIWRLWAYITAFAIWTLEKLFDLHRDDINERIRLQKTFRLPWYRDMALKFQYGYGISLGFETDYYDNSNLTETQINDSRIVKYAAVNEVDGVLIIKIATEQNGELQRITDEQEDSFKNYINRIKAAGVEVRIINAEPDVLSLDLLVYYDPLLLNKNGDYIQGGEQPVKQAIEAYLKKLPFNGELVLAHLIDALQNVPGVVVPHINAASVSWLNSEQSIAVRYLPASGYFKLNQEELNIQYEPNI